MGEARAKRIQEIDRLYEEVREYRSKENFVGLVNFVKRFPYIGPYNAMLVYIQKPGSRFVATPEQWRRFGRQPKRGARPLVILRMFGPVGFVYELEDTEEIPGTEGDLFPERLLHPFQAQGNGDFYFPILKDNLKREGIGYREENYGASQAGALHRNDDGGTFEFLPKTPKGKAKEVPHDFDMVVNRNHDEATKCATIFHELGHYFAGHLGGYPDNKHVADRRSDYLTQGQEEFEAETICYLVCERLGIKNPSAQYLHGYLDRNAMIPDGISIDTILKAAGKIERMLKSGYPLREKREN